MKSPAQGGDTGNVPVPHRGHGHHQEVDTVPVGQALAVQEVGRVTRVLELKDVSMNNNPTHVEVNYPVDHNLII